MSIFFQKIYQPFDVCPNWHVKRIDKLSDLS